MRVYEFNGLMEFDLCNKCGEKAIFYYTPRKRDGLTWYYVGVCNLCKAVRELKYK